MSKSINNSIFRVKSGDTLYVLQLEAASFTILLLTINYQTNNIWKRETARCLWKHGPTDFFPMRILGKVMKKNSKPPELLKHTLKNSNPYGAMHFSIWESRSVLCGTKDRSYDWAHANQQCFYISSWSWTSNYPRLASNSSSFSLQPPQRTSLLLASICVLDCWSDLLSRYQALLWGYNLKQTKHYVRWLELVKQLLQQTLAAL